MTHEQQINWSKVKIGIWIPDGFRVFSCKYRGGGEPMENNWY